MNSMLRKIWTFTECELLPGLVPVGDKDTGFWLVAMALE